MQAGKLWCDGELYTPDPATGAVMLPYAREGRKGNMVVAIPAGNRPAAAGSAGGGGAAAATAAAAGGGGGDAAAATAAGGSSGAGRGAGTPQEVVMFIQNFE